VPGFHIENFGCRAARADGEAVSAALRAQGHAAGRAEDAAVIVVNTCSVTAEADREARAYIRRSRRRNPGAKIVVTGCYAQRAPEELAWLEGVAAVVGNSHKALLPRIAAEIMGGADAGAKAPTYSAAPSAQLKPPQRPRPVAGDPGTLCPDTQLKPGDVSSSTIAVEPENSRVPSAHFATDAGFVSIPALIAGSGSPAPAGHAPIWADDRFAHSFLEEAQVLPGKQTRPNLKIQEGCGNRCTFCVIPQTRGSSRSLPHAAVLRQVRGFVAARGKELVLSGINLGRWGRDLAPPGSQEKPSLARLIATILRETDLPRLRLSSIEPMDWTDELIGLLAEQGGGRICRHAHLPLQSGSDGVLRRMHRRYRPWHYAQKVAALVRAVGPELTLGADVMVGFPGETDAEFEETLDFIRTLPFGYLHLFPFSPRPGTAAAALHAVSPVSAGAVAERMTALRDLAAEKTRAHRAQFAGREVAAVTLNTPAHLAIQGRTSALTENFLPVEIAGRLNANQLCRLRVFAIDAEATLHAVVADGNRVSAKYAHQQDAAVAV